MIMSLPLLLDQHWPMTVLLLSARLSAMLLVSPFFTTLTISPMVRVILVFSLAVALSLNLPELARMPEPGAGTLIAAFMAELAIGAILGLGVLLAFAAFSVAGRLLDVQIGFGMAQVYDPVSRRQVPILTSIFDQLAVIIFFLANGHHALLRGLAYSIERFPPGQFAWSQLHFLALFRQVSGLFSLGFALVAPVVFCIFLLEFVMGVLTRNLPQMQIFVLAIPIKIIVGMAALGLWFSGAQGVMLRTYGAIFQTWEAVFK